MGFLLIGILALAILRNLNRKKLSNKLIAAEKAKSDKLLLNILPSKVAADLKDEGKSKPMQINVSESTHKIVKTKFQFEEREPLIVKGKGKMKIYFVKC